MSLAAARELLRTEDLQCGLEAHTLCETRCLILACGATILWLVNEKGFAPSDGLAIFALVLESRAEETTLPPNQTAPSDRSEIV